MKSYAFPFTAIIGQSEMRNALIYNAIDPSIGGVLIRGEKGTGKSTAVRAIAAVLPPIEVVEGCRYRCHPSQKEGLCSECAEKVRTGLSLNLSAVPMAVVDLPLNASEDRVVGSIDVEAAIKSGEKRFEPGILANAHRSVLYVDEVNLLDDHIVDVLLDVAVTGRNVVEREGITYVHPSRFILVGTMNPEEGDLRPQLLDRFGLCVDVQSELDPDDRKEIVKRALAFQANPEAFLARWERPQRDLRERIRRAQDLLPGVSVAEQVLDYVVELAVDMNVDGHRADITLVKAALAAAAFNGRKEVMAEDIKEVSTLALRHRIRGKTLHEIELGYQKLEDVLHSSAPYDQPRGREPRNRGTGSKTGKEDADDGPAGGAVFRIGEPFDARLIEVPKDRKVHNLPGKRTKAKTQRKQGRYVGSQSCEVAQDIAFDATLRAAAVRQATEGITGNLTIARSDLRSKVRERRVGNLLLFVVDASASMGARERMVATKGAILSLLIDAYQRRDKVGLVTFAGKSAEVILPPTNSVSRARLALGTLAIGGTTPLSAGLLAAYYLVRRELMRDPDLIPLLIIVTDGHTNVAFSSRQPLQEALGMARRIRASRVNAVVLDTERDFQATPIMQRMQEKARIQLKEKYKAPELSPARQLAQALAAQYFSVAELSKSSILHAVQSSRY